jgi:hypothetical protein
LRSGLAAYAGDGRLRWYRSCHFANRRILKKASGSILRDIRGLTHVVLEGGGLLAVIWERHAARLGIEVVQVPAQVWRRELLLPREQRSGRQAKAVAGRVARGVIAWSGAARPTSLRHDAAEAILIGLWGVRTLGWLDSLPPGVRV